MMRACMCIAAAAMSLALAPAAQATVFWYAGTLSGANESPANASPGKGTARVQYDDVAHTLQVWVTFEDLIGTSTASHVHVRAGNPVPVNGGVATQTPSFTGFPLGVHSGTYNHIFDLTLASSWNGTFIGPNGGTPAGAEAAFATALASGRAYLNVHSTFAPGGELRANLGAVPEPASWAMMISGFALAGATLRRRRLAVRFA
jgi:hypothetical protein